MSVSHSTSPRAAAQLAPLLKGEGKKVARIMYESSRPSPSPNQSKDGLKVVPLIVYSTGSSDGP